MQRLDDIKKQRIIDNAVRIGLAGRKSSGAWKKQLIAAAAAVIIGLPVLGLTFPALAEQIPVIGRIFAAFEDVEGERHLAHFLELQELANDVGLLIDLGDAIITIEQSVFDGRMLYFTYTVESDDRLVRNYQIDVRDLGLTIDGKEIPIEGFGVIPRVLQQVSGNKYIGVASIDFDPALGVIDSGEIHFNINLIDNEDIIFGGELTVFEAENFPVSFPIKRVGSDRVVINETLTNDGVEMTITSLLNAPSGLLLHYLYEVPAERNIFDPRTEEIAMSFRMTDNLGNEYYAHGFLEEVGRAGWLRLLDPSHPIFSEEASYLTITPHLIITSRYTIELEERKVILGEISIELP